MRAKLILALIGVLAALAICLAVLLVRPPPGNAARPEPPPTASAETAEPPPATEPRETVAPPGPRPPAPGETRVPEPPPEPAPPPVNKAERLAQLRESFRALAAGDPTTALRAARQLTNDVERETALLALVTEWNHGELASPRQRAWAIASLGLEAGLGTELARNPELAHIWASELLAGQTRAIAPERVAAAMAEADPASALAFAAQLNPEDRRKFFDSLFTSWAGRDTEAALQQVALLSDPAEQDAALKAIRSVAPTGIGAELRQQDGYPVINRVLAGTPAELSGQLHAGDRIVALAQGNNVFVDARGLSMPDLIQAIRGAPGTLLQLQVQSSDAPPDSQPRTIAIRRDQIKYKR